jgi:hypothetical protein
MEKLVEKIVERRSKVRELITAFRESSRQPFPAWGQVIEVPQEEQTSPTI